MIQVTGPDVKKRTQAAYYLRSAAAACLIRVGNLRTVGAICLSTFNVFLENLEVVIACLCCSSIILLCLDLGFGQRQVLYAVSRHCDWLKN